MSTTTDLDAAPNAPTPAHGPGTHPGPARRRQRPDLRLTGRGVATVLRLELRQRVRSRRWLVALGVWAAVLAVVTVLVALTFADITADEDGGPLVFAVVAYLVLSMGLLVAPALAATSVNGERAAGTLAPLQVTLLSPLEIAAGKLLGAWAASLVLLATATPFLLWAFVQGSVPALALLSTLATTAAVLLVVCAIGLGWSAVTSRAAASAALTYVSVAVLCFLSPVVFALSVPLVTTTEQVVVGVQDFSGVTYDEQGEPVGGPPPCTEVTRVQPVVHTERSWWLLALSPYVSVSDAAPRQAGAGGDAGDLSGLGDLVRYARLGEDPQTNGCRVEEQYGAAAEARERERLDGAGRVWPWGLGLDAAVGALAFAATVRSLQVPYRALPKGARVA